MSKSQIPYEKLTPFMKLYICNGCGGKGGVVVPPYGIMFKASCNHHDYGHWKGGNAKDRLKCNWEFYKALCADVKSLKCSFWKKPYYYVWATAYFSGVQLVSAKFFHYTKEPRNVSNYDWKRILKNQDPEEIIQWDQYKL